MKKSYARFVSHSSSPLLYFYYDRCIKLFPQYLIIVALTFFSVWYFGKSDAITLLNQDITPLKIFLNVVLIPANYVFEPFVIDALKPHPIVPPAWSLAAEFHFYLLLPFIFLLKKHYWALLLLTCMAIQFSSLFYESVNFNSNNFGYRYIFGALTIFLFGYAFAAKDEIFYKIAGRFIWLVFIVFLLIVAPASSAWGNPFVQELLLGGFIAFPLGYIFTTMKSTSAVVFKVDYFLGNLAYPIFISHFLSFYLVEKMLGIHATEKAYFFLTSIMLCLFISYLLYLTQKSVEIFRVKARGFASLRDINNSITDKPQS